MLNMPKLLGKCVVYESVVADLLPSMATKCVIANLLFIIGVMTAQVHKVKTV